VASTTSLTSTADDPFSRSLTGILSGSGGVVQERHVALLMQLVKRAKTKPHRTTLLVVLQLSSQEVLRQAVAAKLLLDVQLWLSEFVAEGRQALVQKTLACLDKLPVTLASLQPPCELGKIVGRLRKHESFGSPVIEPAKRLVARWKAMVEQSSKAGSRPATARSAPSAPKADACCMRWSALRALACVPVNHGSHVITPSLRLQCVLAADDREGCGRFKAEQAALPLQQLHVLQDCAPASCRVAWQQPH
jgi:hypothetical protein